MKNHKKEIKTYKGIMMKTLVFFSVLFFPFSGICEYKVVLSNGAVIVLKEKPDFDKSVIVGLKPNGQKISFPKQLINMKKTETANKSVPKKIKQKTKIEKNLKSNENEEKTVSPTTKTRETGERHLILNDKTVKKSTEPEDTKTKTKRSAESSHGYDRDHEENTDRYDGPLDLEGRGKRYWQDRFRSIYNNIKKVEGEVKKLKDMENQIASIKLNSTDTQQILELSKALEDVQEKIIQKEKELQQLKSQKEALENEARRSRALPGWYREYLD